MRLRVLIVSILFFAIAPATANTQSVWQRIKKAAEEAARKADEKQPPQPAPAPQAPPRSRPTPPTNTAETPLGKLPASSAKVESTLLSPAEAKMLFFVSPHGGHVAAVTQKGSRFVIVHDGVGGPLFDEIVSDARQQPVIVFSADGTRYAYVGRLGQEHVVMIDGKEVIRVPVSENAWERKLYGNLLPDFTANSKHSYFGFQVKRGAGVGDSRFQLVFDAQLVPTKWSVPKALVFSADGEHYAYMSETRSFEIPAGAQFQTELIVDGKPVPYPGGEPQFNADGSHLFTRVTNQGGSMPQVFVDGRPYAQGRDIKLFFAPVGPGVVAVVSPKIVDVPTAFLVIEGKKVVGSDATNIGDVFFSPDGKHYAADCQTPARSRFMLIDGKKGPEYQFFTPVANFPSGPPVVFSPDSSRSAYGAKMGDKSFVVVDGIESTGYSSITSFRFGGKDGRRFGFIGIGNSTKDWAVVVDGKPPVPANASRNLTFSPDGSRYAYRFGNYGEMLTVDGILEDGTSLQPMTDGTHDGVPFLFSPDSKHIVHYGSITADRKMGFFIDGKFIADRGITPSNPTFTPDGRHLLWFTRFVTGPATGGFTIYVDGRPAYQVDVATDENPTLWTKSPGAWEMGADGVLTVIAREADALKRIRIAPPADTSIDSLLATSVPMRSKSSSPD